MKWKLAVLASVVMAASAGGCSAESTPDQAQPQPCAEGKGTWIEDDNGWFEETRVTVRLCLDEAGRVLDMEVN